MAKKEAQARIRINKLLELAGYQEAIAAQREAISRYEQAIQSAIGRIWGESLADQLSQTTIIPASQHPTPA